MVAASVGGGRIDIWAVAARPSSGSSVGRSRTAGPGRPITPGRGQLEGGRRSSSARFCAGSATRRPCRPPHARCLTGGKLPLGMGASQGARSVAENPGARIEGIDMAFVVSCDPSVPLLHTDNCPSRHAHPVGASRLCLPIQPTDHCGDNAPSHPPPCLPLSHLNPGQDRARDGHRGEHLTGYPVPAQRCGIDHALVRSC